ncbi:hypothetical protein LTS18_001407, partial [Coniosporium uncinatum]
MSTSSPFALPTTLPPDTTLGPRLLTITTLFFALALLVFALRIYTRTRPFLKLGWDDYMACLAMACGIVIYP